MYVYRYEGLLLCFAYRFGALHFLPKQPVELQIPFSLVAGLQAFLDSCIDVSNGEHAER